MIPPPGAGEQVGGYRLDRLLGGGMSSVFAATRIADGSRVALKICGDLDPPTAVERRARFAREVEALRRVSHPVLPAVVDAGEDAGRLFFCVPLLSGATLAERLAACPAGTGLDRVAWPRLLGWFVEIADALHALHGAGFVHRDVTPANILVDDGGRPWLLDLGLVHDLGDGRPDLTRTGQVIGTLTRVAPEQLDDRIGPIGPWTDTHGLASALYECLTGAPPFTAPTPAATFARILGEPAVDVREHLPGLPANLARLLRRALQKDVRLRHRDARALAIDLRRVAAGRAPARPPIGSVLRHLRGRGRAAVPTVLLAAGLATMLRHEFVPPQPIGPPLLGPAAARLADLDARLDLTAPPSPRAAPDLSAWLAAACAATAELRDPIRHSPTVDRGERELRRELAARLDTLAEQTIPAAEQRLARLREIAERDAAADSRGWPAAEVATGPDSIPSDFVRPFGLEPLGLDPRSGLLEFHHVGSAEPGTPAPRRDPDRGQLELSDAHGIVLVLVPAPPGCGGAALAVAKHEVTRAQWLRIAGRDPSRYRLGSTGADGVLHSPLDPVFRVAWRDAVAGLRTVGLELPTATEWRWAATAGGARYPWHDPAELARAANFADLAFARIAGRPPRSAEADDGFPSQAPVGSLDPNEFGLHDVFGNAWEMTVDSVQTPQGWERIVLGGAWNLGPEHCDPDRHTWLQDDQGGETVGIRAVLRF